ncbi:MAG: hypothetical protein MZW92_53340 [Comamonadaceae bacterium]|nr:hypothetical protein [Comamonadaceae bacterium]
MQARRPYPAYGSIFYIESAGPLRRSTRLQVGLHAAARQRSVAVWAVLHATRGSKDDGVGVPGHGRRPELPAGQPEHGGAVGAVELRHPPPLRGVVHLPAAGRQRRHPQHRVARHRHAAVRAAVHAAAAVRQQQHGQHRAAERFGPSQPRRQPRCLPNPGGGRSGSTPAAFAVAARIRSEMRAATSCAGLGIASVDLALARRDSARRAARSLWVEAQVFNLLNQVNYDLPELYADEPATFGRIFSAKAARQAQLALRFNF